MPRPKRICPAGHVFHLLHRAVARLTIFEKQVPKRVRTPFRSGRTNKTVAGARRQTVIVSVLESLRQHLSPFTRSSIIGKIRRWSETGRSCLARWAVPDRKWTGRRLGRAKVKP